MRPPCTHCRRVHTSTDTIAQHRFDPTVPTTYRAAHPFAVERETRAEAEADMCRFRQENQR